MESINWVLVRGLSREAAHWGAFPDILTRQTRADHVVALDLPGAGVHNQKRTPCSIAEATDFIRSELGEQVNTGRWGLVAISLGGMIALDWLHRYPGDFECAVIMNSSAGNLSLPYQRMRPKAALGILSLAFTKDSATREKKVLEMTTNMAKLDAELIENYACIYISHPVSRMNFIRQLVAAIRFRVPAKLQTPLLFLAGQSDEFTHPICSEKLAKHFNAPLQSHPNAAHDITLDDPAWVAETINCWLHAMHD